MSRFHSFVLAGAAVLMTAGVASAADTQAKYKRLAPGDCFSSSQWRGWSAPDSTTLYLRVRANDIYRLDVKNTGSLSRIGGFLINEIRGSDRVCSPIDLSLSMSDTSGFRTPLFIDGITRLTPEEVAALPKKDRP